MALQLGALHKALLNAGASPDDARAASEEVAEYESRMASIDTRLSVLTWMVATLVVVAVGNLWLSMNILSRLPR